MALNTPAQNPNTRNLIPAASDRTGIDRGQCSVFEMPLTGNNVGDRILAVDDGLKTYTWNGSAWSSVDGGGSGSSGVVTLVPASRALTATDNGKTFECAAGVVLTNPGAATLGANFGCAVMVPSGSVSIASANGTLLNGATSTLVFAASQVFAILVRADSSNGYLLTGTSITGSAVAPTVTTAPAIVGSPMVGVVSSYTAGVYAGTPAPTLTSIAWKVGGTTVSTSATYTPITADAAGSLTVSELMTNSAGSVTGVSAAKTVAAASAVAPSVTTAPVIIGTPTVGVASSFTLASYGGNPAPTRTSIAWKIGATTVGTGSTYTPVSGDVAGSLTVSELMTNASGSVTGTSAAKTVASAAGSAGIAAPTLTGSPTLLASWDFNNASSLTVTSGSIDSVAGSDGTAFTLTNTGSARPTLEARSSKNAARFTAASVQWLGRPDDMGLSSNTVGVSIVVIAEAAAANISQAVFDVANSTASASLSRHMLSLYTGSQGWLMRKADATATADAAANTAYTTGVHLAIGRSRDVARGATLNVDGQGAAVVSAVGSPMPTGLTATKLGARTASGAISNPLDGWVYRVLVYSTDLTDVNAEEIAGWSATNYGTTNGA